MTLLFCVTSVLLFISHFQDSLSLSHSLIIGEGKSVRLKCGENRKENARPVWKFNNITLISSSDRYPGTENVLINNLNSSITELVIEQFMASNEGTYSCLINKELVKTEILEIDDCESLFSLNGGNIEEVSFITAGIPYNISCTQRENCKKSDIVEISTRTAFQHENGLKDEANRTLYTWTGSVTFIAIFPENAIHIFMTCERNSSNDYSYKIVARKTLPVYVTPVMKIQVNNFNMSGEITVEHGEVIALKCVAFGSRPEVLLYWKSGSIDKYIDTGTKKTRNFHYPILFDYESELEVTVQGNIHISCSSNFSSYPQQSATLDIVIKDQLMLVMLLSLAAFLLCITLISVFMYKRRKQGTLEESFYPRTSMDELDKTGQDTKIDPGEATPKTSVALSTQASMKEELQGEEDESLTSSLELITLFPAGNTFSYWKASNKDSQDNEFIVAKTVSDTAKMKDGYNFLKIAASLRKLENHPNIVMFKGCSLNKVPYFIYQEYIENGNLRDLLLSSYHTHAESSDANNDTDDGLQHPVVFVKEVADGISFLHANGLCHPALCARKVLLGTKLTPKLFDIWPIDLSGDRIDNLKEGKSPPIAWLAPETVFLSEYGFSSEVWSYGILLWEVFSFGATPYQNKNRKEVEEEIRNLKYLEQPACCPGAVFSIMLSTWHKNSRQRPSMSEVIRKLDELYDDIVKVDMKKPSDSSYVVIEPNEYKIMS